MKQKNLIRVLFGACFLYSWVTLYTKSACIIVHGTWASGASWYQSGGDFFEEIFHCVQELSCVDEVISFSWSGCLSSKHHFQAAQLLIDTIMSYDFVILVAHSHGATVGILASQIMAQKFSPRNIYAKIKKFYALGVPVDPSNSVYPDMWVIDKFYNLFSFGDIVQPIQGMFNRCFADHERLANISVVLNGACPSHTNLHHSLLGRYILKIPEIYQQQSIHNFEFFSFSVPGEIIFSDQYAPIFMLQPEREKLLELNNFATYMSQSMEDNFFWRKVLLANGDQGIDETVT